MHYKYSSEFAAKARREAQRGQHFGGAVEYRSYLRLVERGLTSLWLDGVSSVLDLNRSDALQQVLEGVEPPLRTRIFR